MTEQADFLEQLRDPEAFAYVIKPIRRIQDKHSDFIRDYKYTDIPHYYPEDSRYRTWGVVLYPNFTNRTKFGTLLHIEQDIINAFKHSSSSDVYIHVTVIKFALSSTSIRIYVSYEPQIK